MVWGSTAKVNVIGFSDVTHKFFPAALCVSSAETIEIYEGILGAMPRPMYVLDHITAAVRSAFDPSPRRLMCYAIKARENEAFSCTCQIGIKKQLCKHILLVKHQKGAFRWPEEFAALPLNTKFTGRPRKRQLVTRYQGN